MVATHGHIPAVLVESAKPSGNGWLASGTVSFTVTGDDIQPTTLTFPFQDAESHSAAIRQAAKHLQRVAQMFSDNAARALTI